jgi:hypothetical protein
VLIFSITGAVLLAALGGGIWLEMRMFQHSAQDGQREDPFLEILAVSSEIPQAVHQRQLAAAHPRLRCDDLGGTDA